MNASRRACPIYYQINHGDGVIASVRHLMPMVFSVRDLAVLTLMSALLLVNNVFLSLMVLAGSCAALMILILTFFGAFVQKLRVTGKRFADFRVFALALMVPISWFVVLYTSAFLAPSNTDRVFILAKSMSLGVASAAIPLLLNLEMRHNQIDDRMLYISSVSLLTGLFFSAVSCLVSISIIAEDELAVLRITSLCGMLGSVFAAWLFLRPKPEDDGEPSDKHRVAEPN